MDVIRPRWASWSFLLYAGGLTILLSAGAALGVLSGDNGDAAYTGYSALLFAGAAAVAFLLRRDRTHPIAAGIAAVIAVVLFTAFVAAGYSWAGWIDSGGSAFGGFDVARSTLALLLLAAALVALRLFRFPLLVLAAAAAAWFLVTDLLSGGGDGSAVVSFVAGLVFLALAFSLDAGDRHPYAFWLHVAAGLTIGGSLLYFLDHNDVEWALVAVAGLLYVALADRLARSSWAVLGAAGILAAAGHFADGGAFVFYSLVPVFGDSGDAGHLRAPLVFAAAGLLLMALGGLLARRAARQRAIV